MNIWDPAVIWAALGIALIGLEVLLPSFVIIFFGVGALLVAAALKTGLIEAQWQQLLTFVTGSLAALLLVRPWLLRRMGGRSSKGAYEEFVGQQAQASSAITTQSGTVIYRGAPWQARTDLDTDPIATGTIVEIVRTDGTLLIVRAKG